MERGPIRRPVLIRRHLVDREHAALGRDRQSLQHAVRCRPARAIVRVQIGRRHMVLPQHTARRVAFGDRRLHPQRGVLAPRALGRPQDVPVRQMPDAFGIDDRAVHREARPPRVAQRCLALDPHRHRAMRRIEPDR
ncbi:hypothetical protein WR25_16010 [Diploscapter pachys]|uniref:Uncharacterized protein n=1 Tax=Diploscapter pachys TaxID=2018661 RepID=A0A2A2K7N0_9BILA|nr:hypothetical protein WR25_16010 [Diploscapter pachys]